jgi:hypothetical protein
VEHLSVADGQLVRNVIEDGPYGGNGGSAWTDGGEVHLNGHPSAVDVRTGSKLDAIRIKQVAHSLKVLANEKRGGLKEAAFDRSPF